MANLISSIVVSSLFFSHYLAGRGFVCRLQLLGQLTGAMARCGLEEQRLHSSYPYLVVFTAGLKSWLAGVEWFTTHTHTRGLVHITVLGSVLDSVRYVFGTAGDDTSVCIYIYIYIYI